MYLGSFNMNFCLFTLCQHEFYPSKAYVNDVLKALKEPRLLECDSRMEWKFDNVRHKCDPMETEYIDNQWMSNDSIIHKM